MSELKANKWVRRVLFLIGLMIIAWLSSLFLGGDNPIEERCEAVIEEHTGVSIDFSPSSQEII